MIAAHPVWGQSDRQLTTVARNVGTRYLATAVDGGLGLLMLPFNLHHLGPAAYGLWMLTASVTAYFSVLDLGYGGSVIRFVAQYRARRDQQGLNDILSTMAALFAAIGLVAYLLFAVAAWQLPVIFRSLEPAQVTMGRALLLIAGVYVALGFPFGVFGGVMNGFQRYDLNNMVAVCTSLVVATVNVVMLLAGYGLVALVATTTFVRIVAYFVYRLNAYRVFPGLSLRPAFVSRERLREVSGFSVYIAMIDWSQKLSFGLDAIIVGAFLGTPAVALFTIPKRMTEFLQRLTNQFGGVLFPMVVDSAASHKPEHLRRVFLEGTRVSLVAGLPPAAAMFLLAAPLIRSWVGPGYDASVALAQILVAVVAVRVAASTAMVVLKGAGEHRLLAFSSLAAACANVALSLLWIRPYGLVGQALSTLFPLVGVSAFVFWPAACRRVGVSVGHAFWKAVWPPLWPTAVLALVVIPLRDALPPSLLSVLLAASAGLACYAATFLMFAVSLDERRLYLTRATELVRWRRTVSAAA